MSTPVVVQGTPVHGAVTGVANNNHHTAGAGTNGTNYEGANSSNANRDEKVESGCNDPLFVLLFLVAVGFVIAIAATSGSDALSSESPVSQAAEGYVTISVIVLFISFLGAAGGMGVLFCIPQFLIKTALLFTVVVALLVLVVSIVPNFNPLGAIMGAIFLALTICYAYFAWSRIPFATANLVTAMTAVKSNIGVVLYAYFFAILAGVWAVVFGIAFIGIMEKTYNCDDVTLVCDSPNYGILFGMFLCLFFGQQVIQNCVHVTIAGTVGTWWYAPDECGCCSSAVNSSFIRTMTTSFGSICFGSLLVAILQALKALATSARSNGDMQIFACIAECILGCLASLLEYFNKWAFIYVGLYGMSYMKAGKSVMELFQNRGWDAIIADDLVDNVLFLMTLLVGLFMGGIAALIQATGDLIEDTEGDETLIAFVLGLVIGLVVTSILMSTFGSGVNAVIVCFAEGPAEFQQNHPELSNKMRQVWNELYPGSV